MRLHLVVHMVVVVLVGESFAETRTYQILMKNVKARFTGVELASAMAKPFNPNLQKCVSACTNNGQRCWPQAYSLNDVACDFITMSTKDSILAPASTLSNAVSSSSSAATTFANSPPREVYPWETTSGKSIESTSVRSIEDTEILSTVDPLHTESLTALQILTTSTAPQSTSETVPMMSDITATQHKSMLEASSTASYALPEQHDASATSLIAENTPVPSFSETISAGSKFNAIISQATTDSPIIDNAHSTNLPTASLDITGTYLSHSSVATNVQQSSVATAAFTSNVGFSGGQKTNAQSSSSLTFATTTIHKTVVNQTFDYSIVNVSTIAYPATVNGSRRCPAQSLANISQETLQCRTRYYFVAISLERDSADDFCLTKFGARLVTVESQEEQRFLYGVINSTSGLRYKPFWLGAKASQYPFNFRWPCCGEAVSYTAWNIGEPNFYIVEFCVQLLSSGKWNNIACSGYYSAMYFICEMCNTVGC